MSTLREMVTVDADGHVMEPADLWLRYLEPEFRDSAEPDESLTGPALEHLGEDFMVWASDYPHVDASFGVVDEMRSRLAGLPESTQRKVLGENALRFYGLSA